MAKRVKTTAKSLIGVDPLAWLDEQDLASVTGESEAESDAFNEDDDHAQDVDPAVPGDAVESVESEVYPDIAPPEPAMTAPIPDAVVLGDVLRLESVVDLRNELDDRLQQSASLKIDASGVESTDTANLQLISAFLIEAAKRGMNAEIENPSNQFVEAATLLGLETSLGFCAETSEAN